MTRWLTGFGLFLLMGSGGAMEVDIQEWQTDKGARVLFVERGELPIVDLRITFDAGSARDDGQPGLARMVSNLLLEGTEDRSAGEIARSFERHGARVSTGSGRDTAEVSLRSLSDPERLEPSVENLAQVLAGAAFPDDALERVRQQMLLGLRQAESSPSSLAERAFARAIYGDHPYATPPGGEAESLQAMTRADVQGFHQGHYTAANGVIAIVGDLDRSQAEDIARRIAGALPDGTTLEPLPTVTMPDEPMTVRIPFDAEQTHVVAGQPSISRGDDQYHALYLANHILGGGGLTSLLAERMREERGLSYSSSSSLTAGVRAGRFQMATQVRNEALEEALTVLRGSLDELRDEGPSDDRLEASVRNITGSFPLQLDSNRALLGYVATMGFHDLPRDYLPRFVERIDALQVEDVRGALRERIPSQRLVTVLVGPSEVIEAVE